MEDRPKTTDSRPQNEQIQPEEQSNNINISQIRMVAIQTQKNVILRMLAERKTLNEKIDRLESEKRRLESEKKIVEGLKNSAYEKLDQQAERIEELKKILSKAKGHIPAYESLIRINIEQALKE
jgi:outer membrane murein-binding lipoprotein Lpp